jgi:hypothetical protein
MNRPAGRKIGGFIVKSAINRRHFGLGTLAAGTALAAIGRNPKATLDQIFASVPLIPKFANECAA